MRMGQSQTAASYLRIIQHLDSPREARFSALKLLDDVLNQEDLEVTCYSKIFVFTVFQLSRDLLRFLEPSTGIF